MIHPHLWLPHLSQIVPVLEIARAGGGGSSSGGGGGGGGGLIYMLGYVPPYAVAYVTKKHFPIGVAYVCTGLVTAGAIWVFITAFITTLPFDAIMLSAAAILGAGSGLFGWFSQAVKQLKAVTALVNRAAVTDPAWEESSLRQMITSTFAKYQADWAALSDERIDSYTTVSYGNHARLMMLALRYMRRRNALKPYEITSIALVDAIDAPNNTNDVVVAVISARGTDELKDERTGRILSRDIAPFTEYWRFTRPDGGEWQLDGIGQSTESLLVANGRIQEFADANGLFYSLDWGRLLLPTRGVLFSKTSFSRGDVNNHCIGLYHNILIQLYSYASAPAFSAAEQYLVAQAALPKTYGSIIVRPKSAAHWFDGLTRGLRGYTKVEMEWGDFNRRYEVWATDLERVTSFELLDVLYMEQLVAVPFTCTVEVVDNTLYLYAKKTDNYAAMLELLERAFAQMKM